MRKTLLFLLAIVTCGACVGADSPEVKPSGEKKPLFVLPKLTVSKAKPTPTSDTVTTLTGAQVYVIQAETELFFIEKTPGLLKTEMIPDCLRVYGEFADDPGKTQWRSYSAKYIHVLTANGTGDSYTVIVPKGVESASQIVPLTLKVNNGTKPQPPPDTEPVDPALSNNPFGETDGLTVLIVYKEKSETELSIDQKEIILGESTREYLDKNAKAYRIWPDNADLTYVSEFWKKGFGSKRDSLPWLYAGKGTKGISVPLPKNKTEFFKALDPLK